MANEDASCRARARSLEREMMPPGLTRSSAGAVRFWVTVLIWKTPSRLRSSEQ